MPRYEYKVVPAPDKGQKAKGVKTPEGRFALSVQGTLNEMGALGWEYLRAELLPSQERSGLTGSTTKWRNVLVFRRALDTEETGFRPRVLDTPVSVAAPIVAAPPVAAAEPAETPRLTAAAERTPPLLDDAPDTAEPEADEPVSDDDPARAVIRGLRDPG